MALPFFLPERAMVISGQTGTSAFGPALQSTHAHTVHPGHIEQRICIPGFQLTLGIWRRGARVCVQPSWPGEHALRGEGELAAWAEPACGLSISRSASRSIDAWKSALLSSK